MDWKEQLKTIKSSTDIIDKKGEQTLDNEVIKSSKMKNIHSDLIIRFEKRNGKPSTIISNFSGDKQELLSLAKCLKKFCSVGGSAKDDEILLQGDVRKKATMYLKENKYKVRGDIKK